MKTLRRISVLILAAVGLAAPQVVGDAPAARAADSATSTVSTAPLPLGCHGGPAFLDVWYEFESPYSFTSGSTTVDLFQWRIADVDWAEVHTPNPNTTITLHRSDGAVCGPFNVFRFGGGYTARTGYLPNAGYGVWACASWPGGGQCGAAKWE